MSESRRRQILRNQTRDVVRDDFYADDIAEDLEDFEEEYVEYSSNESLLQKRIYMPLPVILMGFLTIIFVSVSLTYVTINWPGADMVFPENPELPRFEAAENPGHLPKLAFEPKSGTSVDTPTATLPEPSREGASRFAGLEQKSRADTLGKSFNPKEALTTRNPVSNLSPSSRDSDLTGATRQAQTLKAPDNIPLQKAISVGAPAMDYVLESRQDKIPEIKSAANTLDLLKYPEMKRANGLGDPTSLLSLKTRTPQQVILTPETAPQKLMQRRFAKAVPRPEVELSNNPLLKPVTGPGLETKVPTLVAATGIGSPVADMDLGILRPKGSFPQAPAATLETKQYRLTKARGLTDPIYQVDLGPVQNGNDFIQRPAAQLTTRDYELDLPLTINDPVFDMDPQAIRVSAEFTPQTYEVLETRQFEIQKTRDIHNPIYNMDLSERPVDYASGEVLYTNLQTKSYQLDRANDLSPPVAEVVLTERQADYRGGMESLTTKDVTFSTALGLDKPVALINIQERPWSGNVTSVQVPDQKEINQRYATAVAFPEKMDVAPGPAPEERIVPSLGLEQQDPWQRYAAAVPSNIEGKGRIVIIIDDMGNNGSMARALGALPGPLNFAFLPYAPNLERQTKELRAEGHELLVHMPMEPLGNESPGPNALLTSQSDAEILQAIEWNLTRFEGFVGVNNHMGSRFSKDSDGMRLVMEELQARGLLFLDSRTTANSEGARWAKNLGLPWAGRDIFLDNEVNEAAIMAQLKKVENMAKTRGTVIAIGHPHRATLAALKAWIPTLEGKGLVLVPLSSVVKFDGLPKLASANPE